MSADQDRRSSGPAMKQGATESREDTVIEHVVLLRGAPPRDEVFWFADRMEQKLSANDHKGHWSNCDFKYLTKRLREESGELLRVLEKLEKEEADSERFVPSAKTTQRLIDEAADVANFAMMIADNARRFLGGGDK